MNKYLLDKDICEKLDNIGEEHRDKLIEDSLSLQRGKVYRHREGISLDYRGYFRGIVDGCVHLEICKADGTLTGKHFYRYWATSIIYIEEVNLK